MPRPVYRINRMSRKLLFLKPSCRQERLSSRKSDHALAVLKLLTGLSLIDRHWMLSLEIIALMCQICQPDKSLRAIPSWSIDALSSRTLR